MQKAISKADADDEVVMLTKGNYLFWKKDSLTRWRKVFGKQANVLKTGNKYVPAPIQDEDFMPSNMDGVTDKHIVTLRIDCQKEWNKELAELRRNDPKFYASLWGTISSDSKVAIEHHENYDDADDAQDTTTLCRIIKETHHTNVNGGGAQIKRLDLLDLQTSYSLFKHEPGVVLGEFLKALVDRQDVIVAAGGTALSEEDKALHFLTKLDPARYASMMADMTNDAARGNELPKTLHAAWTIASNWKMVDTKKAATSQGMQSVFVLADDFTSHGGKEQQSGRGGRGGKGQGKGGGRGGRGGRGAGRTNYQGKGGRGSRSETRTCRGCLIQGHLYAQCPNNPDKVDLETSKAMVAVGDEDDQDEEAIYDANFVVSTEERILFTPSEVLLDNQAGSSLFHNPDLVSDVHDIRPYQLGGIDGQSGGLKVTRRGTFSPGVGTVGLDPNAAANILSAPEQVDRGNKVRYHENDDEYSLSSSDGEMVFKRKFLANGRKSRHYSCDVSTERVFIETVADNSRRYTTREVQQAKAARDLMQRLGHQSSIATIDMLKHAPPLNCVVTVGDVKNADAIFGNSIPGLKGKTRKMASAPAGAVIAPRVTQVQQILVVDIFFIKKIPFLLGVLIPLGLSLCVHLKRRAVSCVADGLRAFLSTAKSRSFDSVELRTDGEKSVGAMIPKLNEKGIVVEPCGPGQHVPVVENKIKTIKQRVRAHDTSLPFIMTRLLIIACVLFCVSCVNMQASSSQTDKTSPREQFLGRRLDMKLDLRVQFGAYVQATVPNTDNTMVPRTEGCIAMLPTGNRTGSVKMWRMATNTTVTRDQFTALPMPDIVCNYITSKALAEGYSRGVDPVLEQIDSVTTDDGDDGVILPDMMPIDDRADVVPPLNDTSDIAPVAGVDDEKNSECAISNSSKENDLVHNTLQSEHGFANANGLLDASASISAPVEVPHPPASQSKDKSNHPTYARTNLGTAVRRSARSRHGVAPDRFGFSDGDNARALVIHSRADADKAEIRKQLARRSDWHDNDFAFTMSVRAAMRERGEEARPVIMAELQQMVDKKVWHAVDTSRMTGSQRRAIIRSSMFLKDKYLASGAFERFKARLVAGGDQQDKRIYENLSSPTAATTSVLTVAAIAAAEERHVIVIDIGGAFLNADMAPTGIKVHMRLDRIMTAMLLQIDESYREFVEPNGTLVVELDKALYGCVESAALWYNNLRDNLVADGFEANSYDACVFNKIGQDGVQITIVVHVDDLMVTSVSQPSLDAFEVYLLSVYPETRTNTGKVIDYIGMTFDFTNQGEVRVTMDNCVDDILSGCGVDVARATPATSELFNVREAPKVSAEEAKYFHTHVAKVLYLAKRVRPECLTPVSFLSTRVQVCDIDDMAKLKRLLGYIFGTRNRGIVLRVGECMTVKAYIDAAYGVHSDSGKSHTGCTIVLGDAGPLFSKSSKQKIVTKSSTEAELVGLSDTASQAIHLRNFVTAQGYDVGPAIIYQDNMSCMALMKRGGPTSERSRHISIRRFWLTEKVDDKEVIIEHLGTEKMFANVLTKPVQGAQFVRERQGLTNWD